LSISTALRSPARQCFLSRCRSVTVSRRASVCVGECNSLVFSEDKTVASNREQISSELKRCTPFEHDCSFKKQQIVRESASRSFLSLPVGIKYIYKYIFNVLIYTVLYSIVGHDIFCF
jgi:hypothetical protein